MTRTLILSALLLGAALPAAAQRRDDDYRTRIDTAVALDRRATVTLNVGSGEIVVTTWDQERARIRATSERGEIRLDASPMRLALEVTRGRSSDTRFEVTIPAGARVSARATNGDITITGARGGVDAATQNGDVRVEDAAETVDVNTLSGDIVIRRATGAVEVSTVNGDVTVADVRGDVETTTVSGDVELRGVVSRYIRGRSTGGDITFDGAVDPAGRYEFASHSGDVYLTIPENTGALLTVATYSGSIDSAFPITLRPGEHGSGSRFTFQIGKGEARISAESFSGDVTIRHVPRSSSPSDR